MSYELSHFHAVPTGEPSAQARFREEYYTRREQPKKAPAHASHERGLAAFLRARTVMNVGRFIPLI